MNIFLHDFILILEYFLWNFTSVNLCFYLWLGFSNLYKILNLILLYNNYFYITIFYVYILCTFCYIFIKIIMSYNCLSEKKNQKFKIKRKYWNFLKLRTENFRFLVLNKMSYLLNCYYEINMPMAIMKWICWYVWSRTVEVVLSINWAI